MSVHETEIVVRQPVVYNDYSLERKAEVLAMVESNGGNVRQVALETGIHHATIQYWIANQDRFAEIRPQSRGLLESKLDKTVHKLIDSVADHDLETATLTAKSTAFGIVFDKLQLLRNLPTSITESSDRQELLVVIANAVSEASGNDSTDRAR